MTEERDVYVNHIALHEAGHAVVNSITKLPFGVARVYAGGGDLHLYLELDEIEPRSDLVARSKVPGGLGRVLFVRANDDLLDALDRLVEEARELSPGRGVSRADVARSILYQAVRQRKAG